MLLKRPAGLAVIRATNVVHRATFAGPARYSPLMQPVSPHRWRALPTALIVIVALVLGAATARADDGSAHRVAAASTSSAIR
jgi:hypothetical protein